MNDIKKRLRKEINRLVEAGYSEEGIFKDALIAIEHLELAGTALNHKMGIEQAGDKIPYHDKVLHEEKDITEQLRIMGFASTLAVPNVDWPMHPNQVAKRAIGEIRRLRHDIQILKGECPCAVETDDLR